MSAIDLSSPPVKTRPNAQSAWMPLLALGLATVVLHLAAGNRYGFHRDELQMLDDARHMDWGFVAYPPVAPLFGRLALALFGTSLAGFRFFPSLATAVVIVLAGLIAKEMGGGRRAQIAAAVATMPFCLAAGALMEYVAFDSLWWVLLAYCVVRLVNSEDSRWWVAIGSVIGIGVETKYTMGLFAVAVAIGTMLTPLRAHLRSKWLWVGVALSIALFLPNVIWQWQHHFVSLDFLRHIHERDIRIGRTKDFLPDQIKLTMLAFPIALLGLWACFFRLRRFRILGWMYLVTLVGLALAKGRGYYLAAAYPMLLAAGATWAEGKLITLRPWARRAIEGLTWTALIADVGVVIAFVLPLAPIGSPWFDHATKVNGDLVEEIGWPELVSEIARVRDSLPEELQRQTAVMAANYGEAGAIDLYGPQHHLPPAISGINSFYARGYGQPDPRYVIAVGFSPEFLQDNFAGCQVAGQKPNPFHVHNEETSERPDIYVCGAPKRSWAEFWRDFQYFG